MKPPLGVVLHLPNQKTPQIERRVFVPRMRWKLRDVRAQHGGGEVARIQADRPLGQGSQVRQKA